MARLMGTHLVRPDPSSCPMPQGNSGLSPGRSERRPTQAEADPRARTRARRTPIIREEDAGGPARADAGEQPRGDVERRLMRILREHDVAIAPRRVRDRRGEPRLQLRADALPHKYVLSQDQPERRRE